MAALTAESTHRSSRRVALAHRRPARRRAYHLHRWWGIPGILLGALLYSLPAQRYRSALISMVVHSAQSVVLIAMVLPVVKQG